MVATLITAAATVLAAGAEWIHRARVARAAPLAFGPEARPAPWTHLAPPLRILAIALLAWALATLAAINPKIHKATVETNPDEIRHVLLVLDVSPSMQLVDAGPAGDLTRTRRAADIMRSFFARVVMERVRLSVVATYTGAKPVVVDTKDINVVRNILEDLPMAQAFEVGKTRLFDGLQVASEVAAPWPPGTATLVVVSDGDTVPATGMPQMPNSIDQAVVVGVGNPKAGSFIDGKQSRQDAATLRQIAVRLRGEYHDGNAHHLKSDLLAALTHVQVEGALEKAGQRELALAAATLGGLVLALLPLALALFGSRWANAAQRGVRHDGGTRRSPLPGEHHPADRSSAHKPA